MKSPNEIITIIIIIIIYKKIFLFLLILIITIIIICFVERPFLTDRQALSLALYRNSQYIT